MILNSCLPHAESRKQSFFLTVAMCAVVFSFSSIQLHGWTAAKPLNTAVQETQDVWQSYVWCIYKCLQSLCSCAGPGWLNVKRWTQLTITNHEYQWNQLISPYMTYCTNTYPSKQIIPKAYRTTTVYHRTAKLLNTQCCCEVYRSTIDIG